MTATYTTPWATYVDAVRFYVSDTDLSAPIWQDEELASLLANNSNDPRLAAAEALDALAAKYARNAIAYAVTGFSLDRRQVADTLRRQASQLRTQAAAIPFEYESVLDHYVDEQGYDRSNYPTTPVDPEPPTTA